jgi:hypothetical protein
VAIFTGRTGSGKTRFCQTLADLFRLVFMKSQADTGIPVQIIDFLKPELPGFNARKFAKSSITILIELTTAIIPTEEFSRTLSSIIVPRILFMASKTELSFAEFLSEFPDCSRVPLEQVVKLIRSRNDKFQRVIIIIDQIHTIPVADRSRILDEIQEARQKDKSLFFILTSYHFDISRSSQFDVISMPLLSPGAVDNFINPLSLQRMAAGFEDYFTEIRVEKSDLRHLVYYLWNFTGGNPLALRAVRGTIAHWEIQPVAFGRFIGNCANSFSKLVRRTANEITLSELGLLLSLHGGHIGPHTRFLDVTDPTLKRISLNKILSDGGVELLRFNINNNKFYVPFLSPIMLWSISVATSVTPPLETGNFKKIAADQNLDAGLKASFLTTSLLKTVIFPI